MSSFYLWVVFMSATTLFYLLTFLVLGVWVVAIISFVYGRKLMERQTMLMKQLLPCLKQLGIERETIRSLSIPDTTPLSKLRDMTLPDNVQVDFQHNHTRE